MIVLTTIACGEGSRITDARRSVARTSEEWRALWALHAGPDVDAPAVDFSTATVAAAFAGERPSAGYSVEIVGASQDEDVVLVVEQHTPGTGMVAAQILTSPFHIVSVPRAAAAVRWVEGRDARIERPSISSSDERDRPLSTHRSARMEVADSSKTYHDERFVASSTSSTGLDPRTASALAYLAGPFSGVLILLAESTNDDVRFHAWQSIVGLGGLGVAIAVSYLLAGVALFVSATGMSVMIAVATVIWIVLGIVWVVCLWKATRGERWKLPLAGDYAERFATGRRA